MITKHKVRITKDTAARRITVIKELNADVQQVWDAWTDRSLLDQWWAPKPWRCVTREMDFQEGGEWLYSMRGPKGEIQWAKMEFEKIDEPDYFTSNDSFCDEKGTINHDFPTMHWSNRFTETDDGTRVEVEITFEKEEDMKKLLDTGFEEGFTAGLNNLEELLSE